MADQSWEVLVANAEEEAHETARELAEVKERNGILETDNAKLMEWLKESRENVVRLREGLTRVRTWSSEEPTRETCTIYLNGGREMF